MVTKAEAKRMGKGKPYFSDNGWRDWLALLAFLALPVGALVAGNFLPVKGALQRAVEIYADEDFPKPDWAPPAWALLVGDAYSALALGMAAYLVWKVGAEGQRWPALLLFLLHLPAAAAFAHLFATLGEVFLASQLLAALSGVGLALVVASAAHSRAAALLLLPYLALLVALTLILQTAVVEYGVSFEPAELGAPDNVLPDMLKAYLPTPAPTGAPVPAPSHATRAPPTTQPPPPAAKPPPPPPAAKKEL